ncbi:MAG: aspartate--tRNA ligase [Bacteriovoracaceae bacterium]|jgi:aspartyl-tRNA synthetase|nr:aspartate--tRNA ligase [Bacteriovoracaceae bacterium]
MNHHNTASSNLQGLMRTHHCGELTAKDIGKEVVLCGWNNKYRDLGGLHFVDIRDKYGLTQLAFDEFGSDLGILKELSLESVISAKGVVRARPESALNKNMATGEVEISVKEFEILSYAHEVPFLPHGKVNATEDLRLKYRYMDLRSDRLQNLISIRSKAMQATRTALYSEGFTEVETPILYKTTPEGARDYVVPSRVHPGKVYALPQSPQTLKQLLMIANTDKYFQICKCFRDEDLRADRQPEFTQIDIEVSFATQEYMKNLTTSVVRKLFGFEDSFEIPVMSYDKAMNLYGTDKPDVRFDLKHMIVNDEVKGAGFKVFDSALEAGGMVKAMFIEKSVKEFSRKELDALTEVVKPHGGKGVAWFKVNGTGLTGGISKFINEQTLTNLQSKAGKADGTFFFFADAKQSVVHACADVTRRHFGKTLDLIDKNDYKFLWVNDWPLLEYDEDEKRFYAVHHPFTMPKADAIDDFVKGDIETLKNMKAEAYDIVCNGYEMGGGSLRIFDTNVQEKMFQYLGFSSDEIEAKFGFFVEALKYGTPPHGGFAFGLDRTVMLIAKTENIRDVIAFPKTNAATDLMCSAPSIATADQYEELHIKSIQ